MFEISKSQSNEKTILMDEQWANGSIDSSEKEKKNNKKLKLSDIFTESECQLHSTMDTYPISNCVRKMIFTLSVETSIVDCQFSSG